MGLVRADAAEAEWRTTVDVVKRQDGRDFRGPAVHGKAGERFLCLTWGMLDGDVFTMFRRGQADARRGAAGSRRRAGSCRERLPDG